MKDNENTRGKALGPPEGFHEPELHNLMEMEHQDAHHVERKEAQQYRYFRSNEGEEDVYPNPWRPLEIDPTMKFMRERSKYLVLC